MDQVDHYISQLQSGSNKSQYSWALHEVATLNCASLEMVKDQLFRLPQYERYYNNITCDQLRSSKIEPLNFQFWDDEIVSQFQSISQREELVSVDLLGYQDSPLLHFLLLMQRSPTTYYTREYLKDALKSWLIRLEQIQNKKSLDYSLVLSNSIRAAYILDEYDTLNKLYDAFLNQELLPNSMHKLRLLGAFDYTFYLYGNYHKSLNLQRIYSLPLASYIGTNRDIRSIKNRQGAYLFSLGKYEESKSIYEGLFNDSVSIEDQYSLFTNLGINYLKLGQSNKYLTFQLRALEQDIENYRSKLGIYRNLFIYYTGRKDISSAMMYIERAKSLARQNNDTTELALINSYLGSFYWKNYHNHNQALNYLQSAEEALSDGSNYTNYVTLLLEKGTIYSEIDSLSKADSLFGAVKEFTKSRNDTPKYIESLIYLASLALKKNDITGTSSYLEEIKLYPLDDLDFPLLTKYYTVRAHYLHEVGSLRSAITNLKPIIAQVIDRTKSNSDSQEGYWSVEQEYLDAFSLITNMLIESGAEGEALILLDQLKTINDASLYNSPLVKASKLSEEDLAEEKRLNERLQVLRKKYINASEEDRFAFKSQIDQTAAAREQILSQVNLNKGKKSPPLWAIQRFIQPEELILHFTQIGSDLYVSYLRSNDIQIRKFDYSQENQERFNFIADELASGKTNLNDLYELYRFLDLSDLPKDITQITVIPESNLYRIPLEILPSRQPNSPISYGSTHYLIEDYRFRYFTSLKDFESNKRGTVNKTTQDFAGFAISNFSNFENAGLPSLPYAAKETRDVQNALTALTSSEIYTENDATKANFKEQVGKSRIVHVATHSEVSEQDPLFSTIYLTNSNTGDTLQSEQALYAYELFDTPLNSEFIMLNSCSSGSGNFIQGSGVMGISRALRYAGAKSLALNLWSVNDKVASEFATDFYTYLNEGYTKSEAIRKAKLNQIKTANANPHFWGAYMMIGNPSPITRKPTNTFLLFGFLMATTLFAGIIVFRNSEA